MSERRLTEAEWRRLQASQECDTFGHAWQVLYSESGRGAQPAALICDRDCGAPTYTVARDSKTVGQDEPA